jgi:UDP-N-acetylglucosamine 3-dehydrogenase
VVSALSKNPKKRIVVVGLGAMGSKHIDAVLRGDSFELIALVDIDQASWRAELPCFSTVESLMEKHDFDGAIVAVSCLDHYDVVHTLLNKGIPVLVEKPLVLEYADAKKLIECAHEVPLMVGHSERYNPAWQAACGALDSIGSVHSVSAQRSLPVRRRDADRDVLYDLMVHDLDLVFSVWGHSYLDLEYCGERTHFQDRCTASFTIGATVVTCSADRTLGDSERTIVVEGDRGRVECDLLHKKVSISQYATGVSSSITVVNRDPLESEHTVFSEMIDAGVSDSTALQCAAEAVSVCQQGHTYFTTEQTHLLVESLGLF